MWNTLHTDCRWYQLKSSVCQWDLCICRDGYDPLLGIKTNISPLTASSRFQRSPVSVSVQMRKLTVSTSRVVLISSACFSLGKSTPFASRPETVQIARATAIINDGRGLYTSEERLQTGRTDRRPYLQLSFVIASVAPILASFSSSPVCKHILYHLFSFPGRSVEHARVVYLKPSNFSRLQRQREAVWKKAASLYRACVNSGFHQRVWRSLVQFRWGLHSSVSNPHFTAELRVLKRRRDEKLGNWEDTILSFSALKNNYVKNEDKWWVNVD